MYKFLSGIAFVGMFAIMAVGCRSTKKISKAIGTPSLHKDSAVVVRDSVVAPKRDPHTDSMAVIKQTVAQLAANHLDFRTFSGHMHVHYEGGDGKDYEVNAF